MYDYFYGAESEQFSFYRIPKMLFTNERFRTISAEAKILYGLLLDRMNLSAKNGWQDKDGKVYIIFTIEDIMNAMGCADQKAGNYIYFCITRNIVTTDSDLAIIVVSIASGVGCCLAMALNNKFSKERTFVNVIMSDDLEAMQQFRDFLAKHHVTNVAADSYTLD